MRGPRRKDVGGKGHNSIMIRMFIFDTRDTGQIKYDVSIFQDISDPTHLSAGQYMLLNFVNVEEMFKIITL